MLHFCLVAAATIPIYLIFLCAKPKIASSENAARTLKQENFKGEQIQGAQVISESPKPTLFKKKEKLIEHDKSEKEGAKRNDREKSREKDISKKKEKEDDEKDDERSSNEDNRTKWAHRVIQTKCKAISQEFTDKIKKYAAPNMTSDAHNGNPIKNRYTDVLCLDATRVVIKGRDKDDYIHASWIHIPDNSCRYICTQGPLTETLEDFWAMVFQEKTKFVVMLCNIIEGGAEKCVLYWPEKNGQIENYGAYLVKNVEVKPDPVEGVRWSLLDIIYKEETFQVYHVFVTWWPDQLAPIDPAPMVNLYKWVKRLNEKDHPILVHCSAGVGRTATFVGIDYANVRIRENANTDLIDVIKEMRAQRYQSIQSHVQYLFLHICLLEYFIQEGYVQREGRITEFIEEYQRHAERKLVKRKNEEKDDSKK